MADQRQQNKSSPFPQHSPSSEFPIFQQSNNNTPPAAAGFFIQNKFEPTLVGDSSFDDAADLRRTAVTVDNRQISSARTTNLVGVGLPNQIAVVPAYCISNKKLVSKDSFRSSSARTPQTVLVNGKQIQRHASTPQQNLFADPNYIGELQFTSQIKPHVQKVVLSARPSQSRTKTKAAVAAMNSSGRSTHSWSLDNSARRVMIDPVKGVLEQVDHTSGMNRYKYQHRPNVDSLATTNRKTIAESDRGFDKEDMSSLLTGGETVQTIPSTAVDTNSKDDKIPPDNNHNHVKDPKIFPTNDNNDEMPFDGNWRISRMEGTSSLGSTASSSGYASVKSSADGADQQQAKSPSTEDTQDPSYSVSKTPTPPSHVHSQHGETDEDHQHNALHSSPSPNRPTEGLSGRPQQKKVTIPKGPSFLERRHPKDCTRCWKHSHPEHHGSLKPTDRSASLPVINARDAQLVESLRAKRRFKGKTTQQQANSAMSSSAASVTKLDKVVPDRTKPQSSPAASLTRGGGRTPVTTKGAGRTRTSNGLGAEKVYTESSSSTSIRRVKSVSARSATTATTTGKSVSPSGRVHAFGSTLTTTASTSPSGRSQGGRGSRSQGSKTDRGSSSSPLRRARQNPESQHLPHSSRLPTMPLTSEEREEKLHESLLKRNERMQREIDAKLENLRKRHQRALNALRAQQDSFAEDGGGRGRRGGRGAGHSPGRTHSHIINTHLLNSSFPPIAPITVTSHQQHQSSLKPSHHDDLSIMGRSVTTGKSFDEEIPTNQIHHQNDPFAEPGHLQNRQQLNKSSSYSHGDERLHTPLLPGSAPTHHQQPSSKRTGDSKVGDYNGPRLVGQTSGPGPMRVVYPGSNVSAASKTFDDSNSRSPENVGDGFEGSGNDPELAEKDGDSSDQSSSTLVDSEWKMLAGKTPDLDDLSTDNILMLNGDPFSNNPPNNNHNHHLTTASNNNNNNPFLVENDTAYAQNNEDDHSIVHAVKSGENHRLSSSPASSANASMLQGTPMAAPNMPHPSSPFTSPGSTMSPSASMRLKSPLMTRPFRTMESLIDGSAAIAEEDEDDLADDDDDLGDDEDALVSTKDNRKEGKEEGTSVGVQVDLFVADYPINNKPDTGSFAAAAQITDSFESANKIVEAEVMIHAEIQTDVSGGRTGLSPSASSVHLEGTENSQAKDSAASANLNDDLAQFSSNNLHHKKIEAAQAIADFVDASISEGVERYRRSREVEAIAMRIGASPNLVKDVAAFVHNSLIPSSTTTTCTNKSDSDS